MKILAFADLHISEKTSLGGANRRGENDPRRRKRSLVEAERDLEWIADLAVAEDVDAAVFAGDLYDRPTPTPSEESVAYRGLSAISDALRDPCPETGEIRQGEVVLLLGNHTQSHTSDAHALEPIKAADLPGVQVVDTPRRVRLGGRVDLFCLPYPPIGSVTGAGREEWSKELRSGELSASLDKILRHFANEAAETSRPTLLTSHVTYAGGEYTPGRTAPSTDVRVPTDRLPDFDATIAGHLHLRQDVGGIPSAKYIGPPNRWSFQDEGNPAGVAVLELDANGFTFDVGPDGRESTYTSGGDLEVEFEWNWYANPDAREFETIEVGSPETKSVADKIVRVTGEVVDVREMSAVERYVDGLRPFVDSIRNDVAIESDQTRLDDVDRDTGLRALFDRWRETRGEVDDDRADEVFDEIETLANEVRSV